jgi:anthranilate phosphoribosyltransferase
MLSLMRRIMSGEVTPVMIAALTVGLRVKKETIGEIAAAAQVMREFATQVEVPDREHLVDIVGTGGDASHTFNISTRRCSSRRRRRARRQARRPLGVVEVRQRRRAGSAGRQHHADADAGRAVDRRDRHRLHVRALHHSAMKHAAPVRKELGVRTIFNILGPLTNPAGAPNQLLGVFHPDLVGIQVRVLQRLGSKHVLVVYGKDGMDEVSLGAATMVGELKDGEVREYEIHPEDFGLRMMSNRGLKVTDAAESKAMLLEALGQRRRHAARDRHDERRRRAVRSRRRGVDRRGNRPGARRDRLGRREAQARRVRRVHAEAASGDRLMRTRATGAGDILREISRRRRRDRRRKSRARSNEVEPQRARCRRRAASKARCARGSRPAAPQ